MNDSDAILTLTPYGSQRFRFLSPLRPQEWNALLEAGLPTGWQLLWQEATSQASIARLPALFDTVGPADLRPTIHAWVERGCLAWDRHPEIEQATACINRLLAVQLRRHFAMESVIPIASGPETEDMEEGILQTFAKAWQTYERNCALLLLATDTAAKSSANHWYGNARTRLAWIRYTRSVGKLKGLCYSILDQANQLATLPIYLPAHTLEVGE